MTSIVKWVVAAVVGLLILAVAAVAAILVLVDPNDYRDDISRLVEENTGQELVIEGDIRLSFFPWLGLDLGRTRLENREGFGDQPFAQIEQAGVAVRLLPLFRREVVMDVVRLDGLLVHLIVNEAGDANWELDLPESPEEVVTEAPDDPAEVPDRAPPVKIGRLAGIELSDMRVIYEDWQQDTRQELGPVNISVGELDFNRDVPVKADWIATLDEQTRFQGSLDARLRVDEALEQAAVHLRQLEVTTFAEGLPSSGVRTRMSAMLDADLAADTASVRDIRVETLGTRLDAGADIRNLRDDPAVEGRFTLAETDLRDVLRRLGEEAPETTDPDVLKVFSAEGIFRASAESAQVDDLDIRLDDTRFTGSVAVRDFDNPMIGFRFEGDRLDADRYLPPETVDEPVVAAADPDRDDEDEAAELPLELMRDLRLDGSAHLGELVISGLTLNDVNFTVKADDGQIRVHPVGARLYGGEYAGDIRIDARGDEAKISVDERLSGVQAREIVTQFLGRDLLEGLGDFTLKADAAGVEITDLLRTLAGQAEFRFSDGAVAGFNLAQMLRGATARLQGQAFEDDEPRRTDFAELAGRLVFDGGKIRNDDLRAQSPLFRIEGGGEVDMIDRMVDYRLTVNLVGTLEGQDGAPLDNLRRLPIPVRFSGNLLSPDISLDLQSALAAQQRQRLQEEEERLRERVREEEEAIRQRVEEEREKVEEEVRERARDELRRLLR